ncbi:MAG: mechanosensitive ion channel, partial [Anaerolineales bacterium]
EIGDTIQVSGYTGKVLVINLRSTEMREVDGRFVIIPNTEVFAKPIVNFTRAPSRRIRIPLQIAIDTDLDLATRRVFHALRAVTGFLEDPAPQLVLESFANSVIQSTLLCWIDTTVVDYSNAQSAIAGAIALAFKDAGIDMPSPTLEVSMLEK